MSINSIGSLLMSLTSSAQSTIHAGGQGQNSDAMAESAGADVVCGTSILLKGSDWLPASGPVLSSAHAAGSVPLLCGGGHGGIHKFQIAHIPRCRARTMVHASVYCSFGRVKGESWCGTVRRDHMFCANHWWPDTVTKVLTIIICHSAGGA